MSRMIVGLLPLLAMAAAEPKVADRFVPVSFESQKVGGLLGERMRINLEQRLLKVDEPGITDGFLKRPGSHPWIGEHAGKFLHAGVNTYRLTKDERLKTLLDRVARKVISGQLADGYLGTYTDDQRWTSWDVWVHKYNLLGLISYYELTGYAPALEASKKMGDLLARTFGTAAGQRDIIASSTHVGMAATSVLEPIVQLYRITGEKRYLDFAYYMVKAWEQPNGPKIVSSLLDSGSVYKTANAKAYEMMSCLVGLVELYRMTGEERFLKAATVAWDDIASKRLYITGTTSSHEHFTSDGLLPGANVDDVGEGCATVTWMQLSLQLLRITGNVKYAQQLEKTVYNQLIGAQDTSNGNICYFTPLIGKKRATPGINCCVSSEPRGISMIPQAAWGTVDGSPAILFYTPGQAQFAGGAKVVVETSFPDDGRVKIRVTPGSKRKFALLLRAPWWTSSFSAAVKGLETKGVAGEFVKIEREWKNGDVVDVSMDMTVKVHEGGLAYPGYLAVQRGPQVLVLASEANVGLDSIHSAAFKESSPVLRKSGAVYEAAGVATGGRDVTLKLIPFAEAKVYRTWLPPAAALPGESPALSAFGVESVSRRLKVEGSITDGRADTFQTTRPGHPVNDEWFAVELDKPAKIGRVVFRHGKIIDQSGWFTERPRVEVRRTGSKTWEKVGELSSYPGVMWLLTDGQPFELKLTTPVEAEAVRVIGKAGGEYASCAELAAYAN